MEEEPRRGGTAAGRGEDLAWTSEGEKRRCATGVWDYPAGTTMHLIINSLDTRGWMSDGVSSRAVEKRDREDRFGGGGGEKGFVAGAEVGGEWWFGERGGGASE